MKDVGVDFINERGKLNMSVPGTFMGAGCREKEI